MDGRIGMDNPKHKILIPFFTIVMPAWNVGGYIDQAIASVANQTCGDWELLIVDDGSTDNTAQKAREWQRKEARIAFIRQENQGLSGARNTGIRHAKGSWILFFDSDDILHSELLERLKAVIENSENIDLVAYAAWSFQDGEELDSEQAIQRPDSFYSRPYLPKGVQGAMSYYEAMCRSDNFVASACLYAVRKLLITPASMRFEAGLLHEDELFTRQLLLRCSSLFYLPDPLYYRRERPGSITRSAVDRRKVASFIRITNGLMAEYRNVRLPILREDAQRFYQKAVKLTEAKFSKDKTLAWRLLCSPVFPSYPWKGRIWRLLLGIVKKES
jgi:glycosyltransferase involved in cell wall biosynthesis